jgi:elongation factor Ts
MVEVNSETDFVPRNDHFQGLVKMIAHAALKAGPSVDAILKAPAGSVTIADTITSSIATIGENMTLRRAAALAVGQGVVASYVHNQVIDGLGKIGVIIALESAGKSDELASLGRLLAQHVAAANPQALDSSGLDPKAVAREKDILAEKFKAQGKPANVIDKIVESGLKTFYKEVCLMDQAYIREPDKTVAQVLKESEGKAGAAIKIAGFVRYALGEGIDKQESDFAAEVAAAAGQR